jgi:hypothetical protein
MSVDQARQKNAGAEIRGHRMRETRDEIFSGTDTGDRFAGHGHRPILDRR